MSKSFPDLKKYHLLETIIKNQPYRLTADITRPMPNNLGGETMHCTSCGTKFAIGAKFCSKCGSGLTGEMPTDKPNSILSNRKEVPSDHLNLQHLSGILGKGGIGLVVVSFIWSWNTFGDSISRSKFNLADIFQCFYSNSLFCEAFLHEHPVSMPYTPIILWVGITCAVAGAILGSTISSKK